MALINKPFTHNPDNNNVTPAESAKVNANDDVIYTEFNGNISDPNVSATANIQQSKILSLPTDLNAIRNAIAVNSNAIAVISSERVKQISLAAFGASATYTKPSDLLFAKIICIGGGGGGAGAISDTGQASSGGGGGGGAYTEAWLGAAGIGATEVITVGTGGSPGFGAVGGNPGTVSSFGGLLASLGGSPGAPNQNSIGEGGPGGSAAGFFPTQFGLGGQDGFSGMIVPGVIAIGGNGGALGPYQIAGRGLPTATSRNGGTGTLGGGAGAQA